MRKISERGLFGLLVMIISMLAVQMSFKSVFPEQSGKFLRKYSSGWLDERGTAAANSSA